MTNPRRTACPVCGSDAGYSADIYLRGIAHYNWQHDPKLLDLNAMVVTGIENCVCKACGADIKKPVLNPAAAIHRGAKKSRLTDL